MSLIGVFLFFIFLIGFSSAVLPEEYSDSEVIGSYSSYDCVYLCNKAFTNCDLGCLSNKLSCDYSTIECAGAARRAYFSCFEGCAQTLDSCKASCNVVLYGAGKDVPLDKFRDLELKQGCGSSEVLSDGCCPGYFITEYGYCCREGFEGVNKNGEYTCEPVSREEGKILFSLKESDFEEGILKGVLKFGCSSGDCEGRVASVNVDDDGVGIKKVGYSVSLSTDRPYLNNENKEIGFIVKFDPAKLKKSKAKNIIFTSGDLELGRKSVPKYDFDIEINVLEEQPIREGGFIRIGVEVKGIDEGEGYIYNIDSISGKNYRSTFYYGGESQAVAALITDAPSNIVFTWKTPKMSTPIMVDNVYANEIPQMLEEQTKSLARGLINKIGGKYLKIKGFEYADELLLVEDTAISAGQDGWWPAVKSASGDLGMMVDVTEKYYDAYARAQKSLARWDTETLHIHKIPLTVTVRSPTGDVATKKTTVEIKSPNVRFV